MGTVDGGLIHLKQSGRPQLGQEDLVQTRPDTRLGPVAKASPAGHPAAADPLSRNIRPGHALAQDIDDAPQSGTVIRGQPSRIPTATRRARGKQRSNAFPQIIRHKINRHSKTLPPSSPTAKPPTPTHSETISKETDGTWAPRICIAPSDALANNERLRCPPGRTHAVTPAVRGSHGGVPVPVPPRRRRP